MNPSSPRPTSDPAVAFSSLLDGGLAGDNVRAIADHCRDWFRQSPSLATFALRSVFDDLSARHWADGQAVRTADHESHERLLLPVLRSVVSSLGKPPAAQYDALETLALAVHRCD